MLSRILYDMVYHTTPILLCVLGGLFAYKAGVLNIALEGMMLAGAFVSALVALSFRSPWIIYGASLLVCGLLGLLFSFFTVKRKGNVIITGLAINMLIPAIAGFILELLGTPNLTVQWVNPTMFQITIPIIDQWPILGPVLSGHPLSTYLSFLMIGVSYLLLHKTKFGTYSRVIGENEEAARSLGISIDVYRTWAILIGALCCAVAGLNLSYERIGIFTNGMTAGRGFIAIAAIYCGRGEPLASTVYSFVFGLARALAINLSIHAGGIAALFDILPYLVMIIILAVNSGYRLRNQRMRVYW